MSYLGQEDYHPEFLDMTAVVVDQERMNGEKFADALRFWMSKTGEQQEVVAESCEITQSYISQMLAGKKRPSINVLNKLTDHFKTDIAEFFRQPACNYEDFTLVPKLTARPRAGTGGLETDAEFNGWYSFKTAFLKRKGSPHAMYLFQVDGDSMEGTLHEDDLILVDTAQREPTTGKIFLVRVDDEFMVKRVEKRPGIIKLISDNERYSPIEVLPGEEDGVEIVGKMVWSCREY